MGPYCTHILGRNCDLYSIYIHLDIYTHTHTHTHTHSLFQPRDRWRNITPMPLGLFIKDWQTKVGLAGYDILFAYFVVRAKSKILAGLKLPFTSILNITK